MLRRILYIQNRPPDEPEELQVQIIELVDKDFERKALNVFFCIYSGVSSHVTEQEIRLKVSMNDPTFRVELLRHVQDHTEKRVKDHIWKWLKEYSEKHKIENGFLQPASFLKLIGKSMHIDDVITKLFEDVSVSEIVKKTGVE